MRRIDTTVYATVDDLIEMLEHQVSLGRGDFVVTCNSEYVLAKRGDVPGVNEERRELDWGGYDDWGS